MIILDPPRDYPGKFKGCSHMCSDLPGEAGTAELLAFARRIGMRVEWLQKAGTRHEHFDVFGARRPRAVAAGAREVTKREIVNVWRAKQQAMDAAADGWSGEIPQAVQEQPGSAGGAGLPAGQLGLFGGSR